MLPPNNKHEIECFIFFGALISLVAIYTIILFVKNRNSILSTTNQVNNQLCLACRESNLNCNIIYNKLLFLNKQSNNHHGNDDNGSRCQRCNGLIREEGKWAGSSQVGGIKGYGKLEKLNEVDELGYGQEFNYDTTGGGGSQTVGSPATEVVKNETIHDDDRQDVGRRPSACTGTAFVPYSSSSNSSGSSSMFEDGFITCIDENQSIQQQPAATKSYIEKHLGHQSSLNSDHSFLTVVEVDQDDATTDLSSQISPEKQPEVIQTDSGGSQKFKWIKSAQKVWKAQRIVNILKQVSFAGHYTGDSTVDFKHQDDDDYDEEPEFINSKKLRSAQIQM